MCNDFFLNVVPDASVDQKYTGEKEMERKVPAFYISNKRIRVSRAVSKRFTSNFNSIHLCPCTRKLEHDPFPN